ncbi:hypothetical protein [Photobacterium sp. TLY01]|uniref:hypothetical protein n=1 Tax=Photobacterium sp. TLY01 TaxID=2907534 RepID=UPI001F1A81A6|nr:hypothetical protein [Photobacterium sp. TLY01]UIP30174.1 hypothetical protein LN341_15685 [Photobacterium sp. TLY01]
MKTLWIGILCLSLIAPATSFAHGGRDHGGRDHGYDHGYKKYYKHKHKHRHHHHRKPVRHYHHHDVVVIKERPRREYHRTNLPELVTFAVVSGITYAIIDNAFYKKSGDNYVYTPYRP